MKREIKERDLNAYLEALFTTLCEILEVIPEDCTSNLSVSELERLAALRMLTVTA